MAAPSGSTGGASGSSTLASGVGLVLVPLYVEQLRTSGPERASRVAGCGCGASFAIALSLFAAVYKTGDWICDTEAQAVSAEGGISIDGTVVGCSVDPQTCGDPDPIRCT